jgi:hypothetical protein
MYPTTTGQILVWMGYVPLHDFTVTQSSGDVILIWTHADPQPTPEEVAQQELPWRRWQRKTEARRDIETYIDGAIQPVTRSMLRDGEPVIDSVTAEAVREFIADCYSAVNDFDDAVDLADLETINQVAIDLPAYEGPSQ